MTCDTPPPVLSKHQHNCAIPPKRGGYSAIPCDSQKNVDAIGIAIPYSAIGGGWQCWATKPKSAKKAPLGALFGALSGRDRKYFIHIRLGSACHTIREGLANSGQPGGEYTIGPLLCIFQHVLQTPRPAREPRNPESPKVHVNVRKRPFWTPRNNGPQSHLKCQKNLLDFFWGLENGIFRTLNALLGFRGSGAL